jgi:hypothetical protein
MYRHVVKKFVLFTNPPVILEIADLRSLNRPSPFCLAAIAIAKRTHARLVSLELRFFGSSVPQTSAAAFLQAWSILADHIHWIRAHAAHQTRVIAIGGGYAGTLASWLCAKYLHVITGSWASSSPIITSATVPAFLAHFREKLDHITDGCGARLMTSLPLPASLGLPADAQTAELSFVIGEALGFMERYPYRLLHRLCANGDLARLINETFQLCHISATAILPRPDTVGGDERSAWRLRCFEIGGFRPFPNLSESLFKAVCRDLSRLAELPDYDAITNMAFAHRADRYPAGETMQFSYMRDDVERDLMIARSNPAREIYVSNGSRHGSPAADLREAAADEDSGLTPQREALIARAADWLSNTCNRSCVHGKCYGHTCVCETGYNGEGCGTWSFGWGKTNGLHRA